MVRGGWDSFMLKYKNYRTPGEFEAGYSNFIDAPVVERWETHFRDASARIANLPRHELAYGPDPRHRIDFFPAPDAPNGAPVLIAIHGGLWFLFDRWMMHFLVPAFSAAGVHVACPTYRLAPAVGLDDIVGDCRRAIAHLRTNAALGRLGDFTVLGHSAAGQLAAVMASTDWPAVDPDLPADLIASWVGVSGFYDIEPFELTNFQATTRFTTDAYRRWSPANLVHPDMPPSLLVTGAKESGLLHEMMDGYAALLGEAGVAVDAIDAPGEDHFSVLARVGDPASNLHRRVLDAILQPGGQSPAPGVLRFPSE